MPELSDDTVYINDLENLKVICDPLRLKIYRAISEINKSGELCNVKQISDELDIQPVKLYYHFKLLETHGFIEVAETRIISGILEKLYRAPASRILVSDELFNNPGIQESLYPLFANLINDVLKDIHLVLNDSKKGNLNEISMSRHNIHLPKDRVNEFANKLEETIKELEKEENKNPQEETHTYSLFYACFPVKKGQKVKTTNLSEDENQSNSIKK